MVRKSLVLAGATVAVATMAGCGIALAGSRTTQDPPAEHASEARYTAAHQADARVTQAAAERAALQSHPGTLVDDTHLEDEGNGLRWEVKTDDGSRIWEVQVDAHTGKVVSNQPDE